MASGVDYWENLKIYWQFVRNHKLLFFVMLVLIFFIESSMIADRFLFKLIVDNGTLFVDGKLARNAFVDVLFVVALAFALFSLFRVFGKWLVVDFINLLECNIIAELKRFFFNHLLYLSHSFHTTHKTGAMISRLIRGGHAAEKLMDTIVFYAVPFVFQISVSIIALSYFDVLSSVIVVVVSVVFIGYSFWMHKLQEPASILANDAEDFEKANISDIFTNIDAIKSFGKEDFITRKFFSLSDLTKKSFLRMWDYWKWIDSGQMLILAVGIAGLLFYPLLGFLNHEITLGVLVFQYTVFSALLAPMFMFVHGLRDFYRIMADFSPLFAYLKHRNEIRDVGNAPVLRILHGAIEFRNVSFSYKKRHVLCDFSLKISSGEKVALVGHSGAGKSTLVKLLYRLYDVDSGQIFIDGKNIASVKQESLRAELSNVPQECILFDDTIYNNIAFSKPGATKRQVFGAIRLAQLDRFIAQLPKKENTIVGERGVRLSGGEKQRVSIARAILADSRILVLDEATSSLDSHTEHLIQDALKRLIKGRTSVIIAHRLSTIMHADKIVVIEKGRIVQIGNHRSLIKKSGLYRKLWNLQKGGYIS